mgnify:CR=1 FL=1
MGIRQLMGLRVMQEAAADGAAGGATQGGNEGQQGQQGGGEGEGAGTATRARGLTREEARRLLETLGQRERLLPFTAPSEPSDGANGDGRDW